jgi:hypothetical protein
MAELKLQARQELERQYALTLRMAKSGVQSGYDRGCAERWDEAFTAGWRAAMEEE